MEEPILEAEGVQARIELLQDRVLIKGKGFMAKPGGDKDIPIRSIASVELVSPTRLDRGYIQFVLGGQEPRTGFWARSQDPYTVQVRYSKKTQFEELKQAIEQQIAMRQGPAEPPPASVSPGTKEFEVAGKPPGTKEFEVAGKPDVVLRRVRGFFDSDEWPYRNRHLFSFSTSRSEVWARNGGPDSIFFGRSNKVSSLLSKPSIFETPGGIIISLILTLITFGAFMPLYFIWFLLVGPRVVAQVVVTGEPKGEAATRLAVTSEGKYGGDKSEYTEPVEAWIRHALIEGRAAVAVEALPQPTPAPDLFSQVRDKLTPQQPTPSRDVPDQIRKLAELRDAGAISTEEFEAKKRDLLDRM